MELNTLIKEFKTQINIAAFFEVTPATVSQWKKWGVIPRLRIYQLRERRPDLFKDVTNKETAPEIEGSDVLNKDISHD